MTPTTPNRLIRTLAILVAAGIAFAATLVLTSGGQRTGRVAIGGPIALIDHTGRDVTEADFKGKPALVFFGFTSCPDFCPETMTKLSSVFDLLGQDAEKFQTLMISVDPERDTVERMALYVALDAYPDNLVGLTGAPEAVAAAAKSFSVTYAKIEDPGSYADYLVEHPTVVFLMDKDWRFVEPFAYAEPADMIAQKLKQHLTLSQNQAAKAGS